MYDLFQRILDIGAPFNMFVLFVLIGGVAGVVGTIVVQIRALICHRFEIAFKRDLVDRGLDAAEIEKIVAAAGPLTSAPSDEEEE